jgi:hypothetical protein
MIMQAQVAAQPEQASQLRDLSDGTGRQLAQLLLFLGRHLVVASGSLALAANALVDFVHPLLMPFGLLCVLLREGPVLGRLAAMLVGRVAELLSLGGVSVGLLAVARCLGGQSLPLEPLLLGAAADQPDRKRDDEQRGDDDGDDENR